MALKLCGSRVSVFFSFPAAHMLMIDPGSMGFPKVLSKMRARGQCIWLCEDHPFLSGGAQVSVPLGKSSDRGCKAWPVGQGVPVLTHPMQGADPTPSFQIL